MRYFLLLICASFAIAGQAQNINLGFRGGASFSNFYNHFEQGSIPDASFLTSNPSPPVFPIPGTTYIPPTYYYKTNFSKDLRLGLFSYLFVEIGLNDKFSLEGGVGYTQRGIDLKFYSYSSYTTSDNTTTQAYAFRRNLRFDYVAIPVTLLYKLDRRGRFHVMGGIYNAFAISAQTKKSVVTIHEEKYYPATQSTSESNAVILDDNTAVKVFDAGLIGGARATFPLSNKMSVGLDLRCALGIVRISANQDRGFQSFSERTKNISFETGLMVRYKLK